MGYNAGDNIRLGCGYYSLEKTNTGHLKAKEISVDPECVKRIEKERKRRIKEAKKK